MSISDVKAKENISDITCLGVCLGDLRLLNRARSLHFSVANKHFHQSKHTAQWPSYNSVVMRRRMSSSGSSTPTW